MSDVRTPAPAPKTAPSDSSASKKERKVPTSAEMPPQQVREEVPPAEDKQMFGFGTTAAKGGESIEQESARAEEAMASPVADGQLLKNAWSLAARNVETIVSSSQAALRGAEEVTQTAVDYSQHNIEQLSTMVRNLSEARTFDELVTLHREHTLGAIENLLDEVTRLNEQLTRTFGQMVEAAFRQQAELAGAARRRAA